MVFGSPVWLFVWCQSAGDLAWWMEVARVAGCHPTHSGQIPGCGWKTLCQWWTSQYSEHPMNESPNSSRFKGCSPTLFWWVKIDPCRNKVGICSLIASIVIFSYYQPLASYVNHLGLHWPPTTDGELTFGSRRSSWSVALPWATPKGPLRRLSKLARCVDPWWNTFQKCRCCRKTSVIWPSFRHWF